MDLENLSYIGDLCQIGTVLITMFGYIPQWMKLVKFRNSAAISTQTYILWLVSSLMALNYALIQVMINDSCFTLLFSCLINLVCLLVTLALIKKYSINQVKD